MNPKFISYFKVFSLFLLIIAANIFIIVFIKNFLRLRGFNSKALDVLFSALLIMSYIYAWKFLKRRLKNIEK